VQRGRDLIREENNFNPDAESGIESGTQSSVVCQFVDPKGCPWHVFELERRQWAGTWTTMLVFESGAAVRCVRKYPQDWPALGAEALEYLSWRASVCLSEDNKWCYREE
jgi:hypothetical protein